MTVATADQIAIAVPTPTGHLAADLLLPPRPRGVVAFAHGSGSSRHSPRNRSVADVLVRDGLATLLVDLFTEAEDDRDAVTAELRFDIPLLGERTVAVVDELTRDARTKDLPLGVFGASTGAAAAIVAAARRSDRVRAVVSRGGRPDLAGDALPQLRAATLLIVGSADQEVLVLNRHALRRMTGCERELVVVNGATHLFEERGAIESVADLAAAWFVDHLDGAARREWPT